ncbi:MAG: hypothetical protein GF364_12775, partial [Candidatus Lokiarchaeota archaeon]|nr:hypothetical protein [Candidatus Lokiarchaeota archaeon]
MNILLYFLLAILIVSVIYLVWRGIKYSQIPESVKQINLTIKEIEKHKILGFENLRSTRQESIAAKLGKYWDSIGLKYPIKKKREMEEIVEFKLRTNPVINEEKLPPDPKLAKEQQLGLLYQTDIIRRIIKTLREKTVMQKAEIIRWLQEESHDSAS